MGRRVPAGSTVSAHCLLPSCRRLPQCFVSAVTSCRRKGRGLLGERGNRGWTTAPGQVGSVAVLSPLEPELRPLSQQCVVGSRLIVLLLTKDSQQRD